VFVGQVFRLRPPRADFAQDDSGGGNWLDNYVCSGIICMGFLGVGTECGAAGVRMKNIKRDIMWAGLLMIGLLFLFSVFGAFLGAERARAFFNSVPLAVYWFCFVGLLVWGIWSFARLWRVPGLFLIHAGCVAILAGGLAGSKAGHKIEGKLFGVEKIAGGRMVIYEGKTTNQVELPTREVCELPFFVRLKDFRLEYYKPSYLIAWDAVGQEQKIAVRDGSETQLWDSGVKVKFIREFANFKMRIDGDKREVFDDPGPGINNAVVIELEDGKGEKSSRYVFERYPGHIHPGDKFQFSYHRQISDYISELEVVRDGKVVAAKAIEVNHPLHYGGYHFYQSLYDSDKGAYTVLDVVSDTGLWLVYVGYIMLCVGGVWHLWLRKVKIGGLSLVRR